MKSPGKRPTPRAITLDELDTLEKNLGQARRKSVVLLRLLDDLPNENDDAPDNPDLFRAMSELMLEVIDGIHEADTVIHRAWKGESQ